MTDLSPSLLGSSPEDAANIPLPSPQPGKEQRWQSARILARSQYSQQDDKDDKTNTPFMLVARLEVHGTQPLAPTLAQALTLLAILMQLWQAHASPRHGPHLFSIKMLASLGISLRCLQRMAR
jgi:hypothetical protein